MFFHVLSKPQRSLGDFAGAPLAARIELQAETFVGHWAGGAQADSVGAALVLSGGLYHFNLISSFRSFLILNVHPISSNHEDSEKNKKHAEKSKRMTQMTHPWHMTHIPQFETQDSTHKKSGISEPMDLTQLSRLSPRLSSPKPKMQQGGILLKPSNFPRPKSPSFHGRKPIV